MSETSTLVRFFIDWKPRGEVSSDGMPVHKRTVMVTMSRPPLLEITRAATEADFDDHRAAYDFFRKQEQGREVESGYPLVHWPAIDQAHVTMLAGHDIFTVEALAKLAGRKGDTSIPGDIMDLAERAKAMMALQAKTGKYADMITDRDRQIEALQSDLKEARATISAQAEQIGKLQQKQVA